MTTKPRARKFRIGRAGREAAGQGPAPFVMQPSDMVSGPVPRAQAPEPPSGGWRDAIRGQGGGAEAGARPTTAADPAAEAPQAPAVEAPQPAAAEAPQAPGAEAPQAPGAEAQRPAAAEAPQPAAPQGLEPAFRRRSEARAAPLAPADAAAKPAGPGAAPEAGASAPASPTQPAASGASGGPGRPAATAAAAAPASGGGRPAPGGPAAPGASAASGGPDGRAAPGGRGPGAPAEGTTVTDEELAALTGRQLRMARRVAQRHGLAVSSDFDAVRQLRARGIDPFQRASILELVAPASPNAEAPATPGRALVERAPAVQLPQTAPQGPARAPATERSAPAERRASEILQIQRDIARRRRRLAALLAVRLVFFVLIPTVCAGWYFYTMATPMFATKSEFVIQQAEAQGASGFGSMFQGTSMATQQDSITVQSYLSSRSAMLRLDEDHGFKAHFSAPGIDPIQRLPEGATNEDAYELYRKRVKISYDPTEGIVKMEVIAADPETSQLFSEALIGYAEEQVDQLTQRLREDQMKGARASYEAAEQRRTDALAALLAIQRDVRQIDPVGETSARTAQISALESERQRLQLQLQTRLNVARPNEAQVNALRTEISSIEGLIEEMRRTMTEATLDGSSLAAKNTELRIAEENYQFQTLLVQQALQNMESAQIEANRQVRYLSMGVEPLAPDEATYPRAFENTVLAFLIMSGIYLMLALTASILREQVSS